MADLDSARKAMEDMAAKILSGQRAAPDTDTTEQGTPSPDTVQPDADPEPAQAQVDEPEPESEPEPETETDQPRRDWPRSAQKRVDKLTSKAKTLEEQLAQANKELEELKSKPAEPPPTEVVVQSADSPLSSVSTSAELDHLAGEAKRLTRSIDRYRRGALRADERASFEAQLRTLGAWATDAEEPDAAGLADLEFRAKDMLEEHIPARRRWISQQAEIQPTVKQLFPELLDQKSTAYARSQEIVRMLPGLRSLPNWQILVGTFLAGQKALEEKFKPQPKPTAPPVAAPKVPARPAAVAAPRPVSDSVVSEEVRQKARGGDRDSMVSLVERQLNRTR